jgi:hypothetical protein
MKHLKMFKNICMPEQGEVIGMEFIIKSIND